MSSDNPPVPCTAVENGLVNAAVDPRWCVETLMGVPVLTMTHPVHGKLSYLLPRHEAVAMSGALHTAASMEAKP